MSIWDDFDAASGMRQELDATDVRRAAYAVARAARAGGWVSSDVRDVLGALGLVQGREAAGVAPVGRPVMPCPSPASIRRHQRKGENCTVCWPGGRGTVATQRIPA